MRRALAHLEGEGQLWRHVGKGTFTGDRITEVLDLVEVSDQTNPTEVIRARLLLEPQIAREAAMRATAADITALQNCARLSRMAETWRQYETADNDLHRTISVATGNRLLLALFDALIAVRRTVAWGRLRGDHDGPPPNHTSFDEHDDIIRAIANRDRDAAGEAMVRHLDSVESRLLTVDSMAPRATRF